MKGTTASSLKGLHLMRLLRLSLLPILLLTAGFAADTLQQVLARMDQASVAFKGLTADMKRVTYTAVLKADEVEVGTLVVKRPKPKDLRALFAVDGPNAKKVSYAGHTAEIYYPASNLVQIYDVDKKLGAQVNKYLLLGFGASPKDLQQAYSIALGGPDTVNGQKATRLVLTPKQADTATGLVKAELWISDETGIAVQQKLYFGQGGDYQVATYANMKINPPIPDSAVSLNAPKNAKKEYPQK
jgi:outer membrane lipoprotein-sorting protein